MTLSSGRLIYETIYWGVVGAILYFNRQLYTDLNNIFEPMFQAYAPVAMFLAGIALFLLINYLREAIASTYVAASQRISGNQPLNFDKGSTNNNIQRTARRLEKKGDFQAAGEAFESLEMWRDAAMVYERGNVFGRAAMAWKNADDPGKAIEFYEKDGDFESAGSLCESEGLKDRASRNFRIAGDLSLEQNQLEKSAEFYERSQDFSKAGSIFEQGHKPEKALGCFEKCGNIDKILEITRKMEPSEYLRRGEEFSQLLQRCAEALVKAGHNEDAAKIFEGCQAYTRAAEVFAAHDRWEQSAELYFKSDQFDVAEQVAGRIEDRLVAADILARIAMRKGDWDRAGSLFEEARKNGQAIDAYKKARNFEGAANIYESMGRYIMAGEMYSSSRKFSEAANAFAKAYDWRNAAECFEESGDLAQAIEAYANAGNYLKAGTIALKMTDYARAVEYLQRIPPGAPDFQKGTAFLATSFYYQCHYDMAYDLFCRVMDDLPINKETLPAYYAYASYLEKNDPKQSLTLFRQILGIDVHYSDTSDHVQKLEKIVTSMSTGYGGTPTPDPRNRSASGSIMQARPLQQAAKKPGINSLAVQNKQAEAPKPAFDPAENVTPATGVAQIILDHYKILSDLGSYGRVTDHIGLDTESGQQVFIRNFPIPEDLNVFDATIDLLKSTSRLSHVHINPLTTFGKSDGMIYTVSPSINGQNLRTLIRSRGPLSVDDARRMFTQILEALDYAHSQDVCHLNLRPEAIMKKSTDEDSLILTGFGVPVRQPQYTESLHQTMPDFDPQYLAPEQIIGSDIDCRTDIYAIGLLLFFALTGRTPFEAKRVADTQEIARMQVQTSLPKPSNIRATLPAIVDEVFLKCVNKTPLSRYQSVSELLADLRQFHTTSFS